MRVMYNIGIIGGSDPEEKYLGIAFNVGKLLAARGAVVVCGGLSGVMESAAKGAFESGGLTVGILPGFHPSEGNSYLTVSLPTGIGYARNFLIVRASDALIAIDGSNGTLSEASFAVAEGKSVISIDGFELKRGKPQEGRFIMVESAAEAVDAALEEAAQYRDKYADGRMQL